jgi:hypothetical protein
MGSINDNYIIATWLFAALPVIARLTGTMFWWPKRHHGIRLTQVEDKAIREVQKMDSPTWGLIYWPYWITASTLLFLPVELYALVTNQVQNTLSDYCWYELDVTRALTFNAHGVAWWASPVMWAFFVVAITLHIWYRSF